MSLATGVALTTTVFGAAALPDRLLWLESLLPGKSHRPTRLRCSSCARRTTTCATASLDPQVRSGTNDPITIF